MKSLLKGIFAAALASLARLVIRKYRPTIIMVTGSVGKTSTKDAVAAALSSRYFVRKSEKSFNSEIGVPLTIIGAKNPWANPFAWLRVFFDGFSLLFFAANYPKLLVLEVGADHPGDLARILKITKPDAVVVTSLPAVPVHVEAYATPAAVREEEFTPALALSVGAPLIYSLDDEYAQKHVTRVDARLVNFGYDKNADVHISEVGAWSEDGKAIGMQARIKMLGEEYPLHVRGAFGRSQLYAPAAALATAIAVGVTPKEAFDGLESYVPPAGRGRIFAGIKDTILIDDSYNSSPRAVEEALASLALIPHRRKVAVLGDMLELGRYSVAEHTRIGHLAAQNVSMLVSVGSRSRATVEAASADGMSVESVFSFENSKDAANALPDLLQEGDVVLVKGSQGVRLERIVKALLADESDAAQLVRQEREWQKR